MEENRLNILLEEFLKNKELWMKWKIEINDTTNEPVALFFGKEKSHYDENLNEEFIYTTYFPINYDNHSNSYYTESSAISTSNELENEPIYTGDIKKSIEFILKTLKKL